MRAVWKKDFAKQDRRSRDLALLDRLIAEVHAVTRLLDRRIGVRRPDERALVELAADWSRLLTRERAAIVHEKEMPERTPERRWIGEPGGRANAYMTLLRVSLILPPTESLDLALLAEVIEGHEVCEREMCERLPAVIEPWMFGNLDVVRTSLASTRAQWDQAVAAWSTGDARGRLAFLRELGGHVVKRARAERAAIPAAVWRPPRLRHVGAALRLLAANVRATAALTGADGDALADLLAEADRVEDEHRVLDAQRRAGASLAKALDGEVERLRARYQACAAGQPRAVVDRLSIAEIASMAASAFLQVSDLWRADRSDANEALRRRAQIFLTKMDEEVELVREAQEVRRKQR